MNRSELNGILVQAVKPVLDSGVDVLKLYDAVEAVIGAMLDSNFHRLAPAEQLAFIEKVPLFKDKAFEVVSAMKPHFGTAGTWCLEERKRLAEEERKRKVEEALSFLVRNRDALGGLLDDKDKIGRTFEALFSADGKRHFVNELWTEIYGDGAKNLGLKTKVRQMSEYLNGRWNVLVIGLVVPVFAILALGLGVYAAFFRVVPAEIPADFRQKVEAIDQHVVLPCKDKNGKDAMCWAVPMLDEQVKKAQTAADAAKTAADAAKTAADAAPAATSDDTAPAATSDDTAPAATSDDTAPAATSDTGLHKRPGSGGNTPKRRK